MDRDAIAAFLHAYYDPTTLRDGCTNGMQVEGAATEITRVALGVSPSIELFERAAASGAQMIVTHHALFWGSGARSLDRALRARLEVLFAHGITLLSYHLPLDRHEQGNNALLRQALGLEPDPRPFGHFDGVAIGSIGRYADPLPREQFVARVAAVCLQPPLVLPYGPDPIAMVGIVSGGAASRVHEAIELGLDAYLTGEATESIFGAVKEAGITFLAAGHYGTERLGVQRLGGLLEERFGLQTFFVEVPCPI